MSLCPLLILNIVQATRATLKEKDVIQSILNMQVSNSCIL